MVCFSKSNVRSLCFGLALYRPLCSVILLLPSFSFSFRIGFFELRQTSTQYQCALFAPLGSHCTGSPNLQFDRFGFPSVIFYVKKFSKMVGFRWKFFAHGVIPFGITNWLPTISIVVNISLHVCEKISSSFFISIFLSPILSLFHCMLFYVMHLEFLGKLKQRW